MKSGRNRSAQDFAFTAKSVKERFRFRESGISPKEHCYRYLLFLHEYTDHIAVVRKLHVRDIVQFDQIDINPQLLCCHHNIG